MYCTENLQRRFFNCLYRDFQMFDSNFQHSKTDSSFASFSTLSHIIYFHKKIEKTIIFPLLDHTGQNYASTQFRIPSM